MSSGAGQYRDVPHSVQRLRVPRVSRWQFSQIQVVRSVVFVLMALSP